ncbi:uncharacterized protein LOC129618885 [Condylostylus longicornis]|uniref:uncharacterized protein LOC129618885 n=1 Tax=Condylostylus longicornis TaxID=2530218 RepID=UPI00244E3DF5|nr:uncharacterized protein LOC129618885 [Condylostylus longicornis]
MRRASFTPIFNASAQEPLIVVEESNTGEEGDETNLEQKNSNSDESEPQSPVNPYLLCPFNDPHQRRKHSLPSLQITEGITASQVRRLSEAGSESTTLSTKEVEFLATLSQRSAGPSSGGRRHSVVTISPVPTSLFGRNRRESIGVISTSRRGSAIAGPPLTEHRGSVHNLQLDIMDGIVQARKTRSGSGMWTTSVNENKVQVQT